MLPQVSPNFREIRKRVFNGISATTNRDVRSRSRQNAFPPGNRPGHWVNDWITYNPDRISLMIEHEDLHTDSSNLSPIAVIWKPGERRRGEGRDRDRERNERPYQFRTFSSANPPNCWHDTLHSEGYMYASCRDMDMCVQSCTRLSSVEQWICVCKSVSIYQNRNGLLNTHQ